MFSFLAKIFSRKKNSIVSKTNATEDSSSCRDAILDSDKYILKTYIENLEEVPISSLNKYPNDSKRKLHIHPLRLMYKQEEYGVVISPAQFKILQDMIFRLECKKKCSILDKLSAITKEECTLYSDGSK